MEQTLQAGVPKQRSASMIHSARNKHPREPESYIAAGLKKLRESAPEDQPVSIKPENQPLEPWEQDWLKEFQAMTASRAIHGMLFLNRFIQVSPSLLICLSYTGFAVQNRSNGCSERPNERL